MAHPNQIGRGGGAVKAARGGGNGSTLTGL